MVGRQEVLIFQPLIQFIAQALDDFGIDYIEGGCQPIQPMICFSAKIKS